MESKVACATRWGVGKRGLSLGTDTGTFQAHGQRLLFLGRFSEEAEISV